jgi:cell division protein ZapA
MAQVTLRINGYAYILGCADGEEEHLCALAADLDRRIDEIKTAAGPSGEARLLLMAALMISDELHDFRQQQEPASRETSKPEAKIGKRLKGIAKRAETIAASAEASTAGNAEAPTDGKMEATRAETTSDEAHPSSQKDTSPAEAPAETTPSPVESVAATTDQP